MFITISTLDLSTSSFYLLLTLNFSSADDTKPLPDRWVQAFWCILRSVQLLHGLQHFAECVGSQRTTQMLLFKRAGVVVSLGPYLLNPEA